jgi:hypothetical protein
MKNLKKYYIESTHDINIDSYEKGELNNVNYYKMDSIILAENEKLAIEKYSSKILGFDIDFDNLDIDDETGNIWGNILVDKDNIQASIEQVEKWKLDKITLYSDIFNIRIYELSQLFINELQTI